MTGLWQVSGRADTSYDERVRLDIFYIDHYSPLMDVRIFLKTPLVMLGAKGAY
jgi:lipopolysaccharide/colanic/teichoic acid biosynthesis glycosyltransferase